jgi:hypothetical protein
VSEALLSPEELRHAALDGLGPYADERTRQALQGAELRLDPAVTSWESSAGPVQGHRVTLAVDAATLARLRAAPALEDALHAALATAIASRKGEALAGLELRWAREGTHAAAHGYRDRPPDPPQTVQQALVSYLEVRGEPALALLVAGGSVTEQTVQGASVSLVVEPDQLRSFRSGGAAATGALTAAVRDLLGGDARVVVQC